MIILIGGASCTGKTLLSQRILEKYSISYLSIDHLKMGLYRGLKDEKYSPNQDQLNLAKELWTIVREIILTNIENKQNIIIEGCYIYPQFIEDFDDKSKSSIISLFLGFSKSYIERNITNEIISHRSEVECRQYDGFDTTEDYIIRNNELKELCTKYSYKFFEIDKEYKIEMQKVMDYIDDRL